MKIPAKIVELGKAIEIKVDGEEWTFPRGFSLATTGKGKHLWIIYTVGAKRVKAPSGKEKWKREQFSGKFADVAKIVRLSERKNKRWGKVDHIVYRSDKFGRKEHDYIHHFDSKPTAYVDNPYEPRFVFIKAPKLRVTARGILG